MTETSTNWYTGQVYYGIKNMVTEGSITMRCAAKFGKIISQYLDAFPPTIYNHSDRGPERKVDNLLV